MRQQPGYAPVSTEFFPFKGGLDLVSPPLSVKPGCLLDGYNYEPNIHGGYTRIKGYERFDGRNAPSDARYTVVPCALTATLTTGDALTIGGFTGTYVKDVTEGILVTDTTGTLAKNTPIIRSGSQVGTTANRTTTTYAITAEVDAGFLVDVADYRRGLIGPVPGSGPVRAVFLYNDVIYAIRDNAGATAGVIYKATATGWQAITLPRELGFTAGTAAINVGDTVTGGTSGATGIVRRVCLETGAWGSAGTGRLIVDTVTGVWAAGEAIKVSGTSKATSAAPLATQVTLSAGGLYGHVVYNFFGQTSSRRVYVCNGVDRAFEFDGTTVAPIRTGAAVDKPSAITAVNNYLWLAQRSSAMYSAVGDPMNWQGAMGAGEIAFGDDITALAALPGQALGVWARNSTHTVTGAAASSFQRNVLAADSGALPNTVAVLTDAYFMDDRGIQSTFTTQHYGNFEFATASRKVQPLVNILQGKAVCAIPVRTKNQYRLVNNDGRVLLMYVEGSEGEGATQHFTLLSYGFNPSCGCSLEDNSGKERMFLGSSTGYVYELDKGSTFDGAAIEAFCRVWYYNSKSPTVRKRYRRVTVDMSAEQYANLRLFVDFSYGDQSTPTFLRDGIEARGVGGLWEVGLWDSIFWDAQAYTSQTISLTGSGTNLSMLFYSNTKLDFGHNLQGAILHFSPRRLQRG